MLSLVWDSLGEGGPRRVLLVHHERHMVRQIQVALLRQGHHLTIVSSCEEAIDKARSTPYHIVMVDAGLPGGRCANAIRELRMLPTMGGVPIWVIGAEKEDEAVLTEQSFAPVHVLSRKA